MNQEKKANIHKIESLIVALEQEEHTNDLNAKIQKLQNYRNDWVNKVFLKIQNRQFEPAATEFYNVLLKKNGEIDTGWLNTDSAILAIMFKIHITETNNGEESILNLLTSLEQMKDLYFELKFLLRRFEYGLSYELKEELFSFLHKYPISAYAICEMVELCVTQKEKVLNEVAVFLFQKECYEQVLPLLSASYERNPDNPETLYNMAYVLYAFQERETALQLIRKPENPSEDVRHLCHIIEEEESLPPYADLHTMAWEERPEIPEVQKPDKPEKIAFILCVNDERYYRECCYYIDQLVVPEGYSVEVIPVYQANSMTSGYQKGMQSTDAKYKIYIHQDVLCTNPYLLYELIHIFERDPDIGLVGVAGCIRMPDTGIWWDAREGTYYNLYQDSIASYGFYDCREKEEDYNCREYQEVQALDGVFLATSKDVDWREDLFDGWHHYDVSQSMEFQRAGYKVVIPRPHALWILHNEKCGSGLGNDYRQSRIRFLREYKEELV